MGQAKGTPKKSGVGYSSMVIENLIYYCPICDSSPNSAFGFAIVSPWVRKLGATRKRICKYFLCNSCETGYMSLRYSDTGMARLYREYRSQSYVEIRQRWEGWYDQTYNDEHANSLWLDSRATAMRRFLAQNLNLSTAHVIDIGGDTGELASRLGAASFVVKDISNRGPENTLLDSKIPSSCTLVVLANVLEHVGDPISMLTDASAQGDYVYVEVPAGIPKIDPYRASGGSAALNLFRSLFPSLWRKASKPSTGRANPAHVLRVSEHLTFFSRISLEKMASKTGMTASISEVSVPAPSGGSARMLQAFFSKRE